MRRRMLDEIYYLFLTPPHHMTRKQHASLSPVPQSTHAVAPGTFEYCPAKHQHASVQHPPPRCVSGDQRACIEDTHLE